MPLARRPVVALPRALAGLAALLAASGCGDSDDGSGPEAERLAGRYKLVAVNGRPLPYSIDVGFVSRYELIGDTLTILDGNRVVEEQQYYERRTNSGEVTDAVADTIVYRYTLTDGVLVFIRPLPGGEVTRDTVERAGELLALVQTYVSSVGATNRAPSTYVKIE